MPLTHILYEEKQPILGVTVVGSGCVPRGYVICEWWGEGESIEKVGNTGQLIKRQRVENLNGVHPVSTWAKLLRDPEKVPFKSVEEMRQAVVGTLWSQSLGFYEDTPTKFYENTVYFRVGPPEPHRVTIRCGCKFPEDWGNPARCRYLGDYTIRVVETTVVK